MPADCRLQLYIRWLDIHSPTRHDAQYWPSKRADDNHDPWSCH
jgi:hypothetical protein